MANRIKQLRDRDGINQSELAAFLNVSQGTLSNWERGVHDPDNEALILLSQKFNVTTDYLLGQSEEIGVYYANNIQGSNFVQGSGSVTIENNDTLSKEETEILRIYRSLDVRGRTKFLNCAFELEDEINQKVKGDGV